MPPATCAPHAHVCIWCTPSRRTGVSPSAKGTLGPMDVGELLRIARARVGYDQRNLALRAGVSRTTVSRYETGALSPTVAALGQLLAVCGLQLRLQLEPLMAEVDARVDK